MKDLGKLNSKGCRSKFLYFQSLCLCLEVNRFVFAPFINLDLIPSPTTFMNKIFWSICPWSSPTWENFLIKLNSVALGMNALEF